jgi:hypothetical protein
MYADLSGSQITFLKSTTTGKSETFLGRSVPFVKDTVAAQTEICVNLRFVFRLRVYLRSIFVQYVLLVKFPGLKGLPQLHIRFVQPIHSLVIELAGFPKVKQDLAALLEGSAGVL